MHENLEFNIMVIGADIIKKLKVRNSYNIEDLFQDIRSTKSINLERYYNALCFLWLSEIVDLKDKNIVLK